MTTIKRKHKLLCYERVVNSYRYQCPTRGCDGSGHAVRPEKYKYHTTSYGCPLRRDYNTNTFAVKQTKRNTSKTIVVEVIVPKGIHSVCHLDVKGLAEVSVVLCKAIQSNYNIKDINIIQSKTFRFK